MVRRAAALFVIDGDEKSPSFFSGRGPGRGVDGLPTKGYQPEFNQGRGGVQCTLDNWILNILIPDLRKLQPCDRGRAESGSSAEAHRLEPATSRTGAITFNLGSQNITLPAQPAPDLILAVISKESGFLPDTTSQKRCKGLMQISEAVAVQFNVSDPFNPQDNIRAGAGYLQTLIDRFKSEDLALAAYNWGPTKLRGLLNMHGVHSWEDLVRVADREIPHETTDYVKKVNEFRTRFKSALNGGQR